MKHVSKQVASLVVMAMVVSAVSLGAQAAPQRQGRQTLRGGPATAENEALGVTPLEIQRMFDAYALVQAQDQLQLDDDLYARFLVRYKALQDIRRKSVQEHTRIVAELRRLLTEQQPNEAALLEARIKALDEVETRKNAEVRQAYEGIDDLLNPRQSANFRVFEQLMERRKLELIQRARQVNRPRQQP